MTFKEKSIEEVCIENSSFNYSNLKKKLLKYNLLQEKCYECDLDPVWNNKKLVLQLDHINGINNDHRLENLRLLCPNCHSQTDTFSRGKNKLDKKNKCSCGKIISNKSKTCRQCLGKIFSNKRTKINWPNLDKLKEMIKETSYVEVGKKLNVSDNAIRKHIKNVEKNCPVS